MGVRFVRDGSPCGLLVEEESMTAEIDPARGDVEAQLAERAWADEGFRRELLSDPKAVAQRVLGITIPDDVEVHVHEETPKSLHFVLPMDPKALAVVSHCVNNASMNRWIALRPCPW
jgi:hypothetical protein